MPVKCWMHHLNFECVSGELIITMKNWICPGSVECVLEWLNVSVKCSICLEIDECVAEVINSHWIYFEFTFNLHSIRSVECVC